MAKLGTLALKGASGKTYDFDVYPSDTTWRDGVECVYYVSKRTFKPEGGGSHTVIYIGETDDLKARFEGHHKQACFDRNKYNAISVHLESNANTRLRIESDLIEAENPPCND